MIDTGVATTPFLRFGERVRMLARSPERKELAEVLYRSSVAGTATFSALNAESDSLPDDLRQGIRDTISALDELGARTSQSLASGAILPKNGNRS